MAVTETLTSTPTWKRHIIDGDAAQLTTSTPGNVFFDPEKHLNYTPPSKVHSMEDLGYPSNRGVSPTGVSEPFSLFSMEAIQQMRKEVLSDEVFNKYKYSSELAPCQLRGYAAESAPFVYDAWKNPKTLAIISKIAGADLVPVMDYEIGHINISTNTREQRTKEIGATIEKANYEADGDEDPIVDWHTDSYPFVCVTMLSDCKDMIGGETALRKGNGEVVKVRGPQMGYAVVLQGRYIEHKALQALAAERITMVTSFRPRSSHMKDDTVLTTVRPVSQLGELYHQFAEYRFDMLQDRLRDANRLMCDQQRARRPFQTLRLKQFIREQIEFLEHMDKEIVEDDKVIEGTVDDSHLISEDLKLERARKRRLIQVDLDAT